ncbi:MAG: class I SAM-dependent methyltransferase [Planctomycetaceae bacterium]|nr:class I SAM-dependent methyltransferase [Planctomycetaceae bacterium]
MGETAVTATVDKSGERVRQMFGEISGRYDFLNHFLSGGTDVYWRWWTVRHCAPEGVAPILDVCTGTGDLALAYWKRGRGRIDVVGTDFTPEMLRIAEQKRDRFAKKVGWDESSSPTNVGGGDVVGFEDSSHPTTTSSPLIFLEADTQHLPFDDDRFQIVSVAFGLRNVSDTLAGLREMTRVCQPGGRVAVLEFSLPGNAALRWLYLKYFRYVLPRIGQLLARNRQAAYNYLPASVSEFPYGERLAKLMADAGLEAVTWTPLTFGIATLYIGRKPAQDAQG